MRGDVMDRDELLEYINRSSYRVKIVKSIGTGFKMPKAISDETGLLGNHVSGVLKKLRDNNVAVCINPDARKGRLYKLTDEALDILGDVRYRHDSDDED